MYLQQRKALTRVGEMEKKKNQNKKGLRNNNGWVSDTDFLTLI
jgi:hypothetical protein